jgi:hypothetical protein
VIARPVAATSGSGTRRAGELIAGHRTAFAPARHRPIGMTPGRLSPSVVHASMAWEASALVKKV